MVSSCLPQLLVLQSWEPFLWKHSPAQSWAIPDPGRQVTSGSVLPWVDSANSLASLSPKSTNQGWTLGNPYPLLCNLLPWCKPHPNIYSCLGFLSCTHSFFLRFSSVMNPARLGPDEFFGLSCSEKLDLSLVFQPLAGVLLQNGWII